MEERNNNYTLMEGHELPSGGIVYDKPINPHIELRSMTARDEMKRLAPSSTPLKTLADIIDGCILEKPGISVYDMCLGDYEFLMHKLRIITYGPEYKVTVRCPECGEAVEITANLDSLALKEFSQDMWESLHTFTLPKSGKTVTLRPLTPRILDGIDSKVKDLKRRFKNAAYDFDTLVRMEECIESIDGVVFNMQDLENIINNLSALDMNKILNMIDKLNQSIGLDNTLYLTCPKCGEDFKNFFRFGPEFFRPTTI